MWNGVLATTSRDIRLLAPLMVLRSLPALVRRPSELSGLLDGRTPIGELICRRGFLEVHRDAGLIAGRAYAIYGAAGRFWSPSGNQPVPLDGRDAFVAYRQPGIAKAALSIEVVDRGDDSEVITETRVLATDQPAIRRSWLSAIDRRATR